MHLIWGFLEGREKLGLGEEKNFDLPTIQGANFQNLSSSSAHLPPHSFPSSQYSACSSKCMNAWMAWQNTLRFISVGQSYILIFPLLTTLSTAGSSVRLWIWRSHTRGKYCCLKTRPIKETPERSWWSAAESSPWLGNRWDLRTW